LLATTDLEVLEEQNEIDKSFISFDSAQDDINVEQCLNTSFTEDELKEGMKEAVVGNEDVGRYV
jgi:hypothetical protein